jgi:hypothetical protein
VIRVAGMIVKKGAGLFGSALIYFEPILRMIKYLLIRYAEVDSFANNAWDLYRRGSLGIYMTRILFSIITLAIVLFLVSSCATNLSPAAKKIHIADRKMVSDCSFLGTIHGSRRGSSGSRSIVDDKARNSVLEQAAQRNATHIVWQNDPDDYFGKKAKAEAYRCSQ